MRQFRSSITQPGASLSTLRADLTDRLRKTRLRLVANLCRPGFHRVGFNKKFQIRFTSSHYSLSMDLSWRNGTTAPKPLFPQQQAL
jgi:hypothetical protein